MRTATHLFLAALTIAAAVASATTVLGSGPSDRDAKARERAAARKIKGVVRTTKREVKLEARAAGADLKNLTKAARTGRGLDVYGILPLSTTPFVALNATNGERLFSTGLDVLEAFHRDAVQVMDSAVAEIAADPDVIALEGSSSACEASSEGGLLREAVLDLRGAYEAAARKLGKRLSQFVDVNAATGNPVTLRYYWLPPAPSVVTSDQVFGGLGPLFLGVHATGRVRALFSQPIHPGSPAPPPPGVRLYSIDGTLYTEAEAFVPGTRTVRYFNVDFDLTDLPSGPGRLQLEQDDGAGGAVPLFWDHIVFPGDGGGGDDPDDEPGGCFFPAQQLAFANVANERTAYDQVVEAALTVSDTELLALTLRFGDDPSTPTGTLRFSIVEGASGVTLDPDEVDGEHVEARITPDTGVLPDVMLDPNGGTSLDAWFLDPGDEYEILLCFSSDPRAAPTGPYQTKIRIVGRGRAGVRYAAPYRSFSFDFAYDGEVDLIKR